MRRFGQAVQTLALIAAVLTIASCSSPTVLRVDPGIVRDATEGIAGIGDVLLRTTSEDLADEITIANEIIIVDTHEHDARSAIDKVGRFLGTRQWSAISKLPPQSMTFEKSKWKNVRILVMGLKFYRQNNGFGLDKLKAKRQKMGKSMPDAPIIIEIYRTD